MPEDQPVFSTKPVAFELPKRRLRRRRVASRARKAAGSGDANQKKINASLAAIYQDDNGKLPDMKKIAIKKTHPLLRLISIILLGGAALAALAWAGWLFVPSANRFPDNMVSLEIHGPEQLTLGATSTYYVAFKNNYASDLKEVTLNIYYPAGFVFAKSSPAASNLGHNEWKLGAIPPGGEGAITIEGQNYGTLNEEKSWRIFLNYKPANFSSDLQKTVTLNTVIDLSPLSLLVKGPAKASLGAEVEYTFTVKNNGNWTPSALELSPVLPANFTVSSSTPALDKNNRWLFSLFSTNATATASLPLKNITFKIRGKFAETDDKTSPIKGVLWLPSALSGQSYRAEPAKENYQIAVAEIASELIKNDLAFNLAINGSVGDSDSQPNDILNITVHLKNTSAKDIKNATIVLALDTPSVKRQSVLKWPELADQYDGAVQGEQLSDAVRRGSIIWTSKKIPALAKVKLNDEINIDVRLPIKGGDDFDLTTLKTSKILAGARVTFTDQTGAERTLNSNPITVTLNSDLKFENRDTVSVNPAGQEQHAVTWVLTNSFHALKNIVVSANAYGDISWSRDSVAAGEVSFATDTKKITWKIAELPESIDVANAAFTITLITKNPTQNTLVSKVHVQAEDAATGKKLDFLGEEVALTAN